MTVHEFVAQAHGEALHHKGRFVFLLGAGCSVTSGIPTAAELVREWAQKYPGRFTYDESDPAASYSIAIWAVFRPQEYRQKEMNRICRGKLPGSGYALLARIVEKWPSCFEYVLSTNFDTLIAASFLLYADAARPLVIANNTLVKHVQYRAQDPVIIKLHNDHHLGPLNTADELSLPLDVCRKIADLIRGACLVIVGYSGSDPGIATLLELHGGGVVYWINRDLPRQPLDPWWRKLDPTHRRWVNHCNFDQLMLLLAGRFDVDGPSPERFKQLEAHHDKTLRDCALGLRSPKYLASTDQERRCAIDALGRVRLLGAADPSDHRNLADDARVLGDYASAGKINEVVEALEDAKSSDLIEEWSEWLHGRWRSAEQGRAVVRMFMTYNRGGDVAAVLQDIRQLLKATDDAAEARALYDVLCDSGGEDSNADRGLFAHWLERHGLASDAKTLRGEAAPPASPQAAQGSIPESRNMEASAMLTTFMSHYSEDKRFVEAVAVALGRRGLVPWLDKDELAVGRPLGETLRDAIRSVFGVSMFLSERAIRSPWLLDEAVVALDEEKCNGTPVMPVFLDDRLRVVKQTALFRDWLHPNEDRVNRHGINATDASEPALSEARLSEIADRVAKDIAEALYRRAATQRSTELNVVIDQRGVGRRTGAYVLPPNVTALGGPTLVFRPDRGQRSFSETLHGEQWSTVAQTVVASIDQAIGDIRRERTVRFFGDAQLAFAHLIGARLNRTTGVTLYCYSSRGTMFTNAGQERRITLPGGNPNCNVTNATDAGAPPPVDLTAGVAEVALYVGQPNFITPVVAHVQATGGWPLLFVKTGLFDDSKQVMSMVADVVALLLRFKAIGTRSVRLYVTLPINVVPLLAANLEHVIDHVEFMEFRKDLQPTRCAVADTYTALPMPPR